MSIHRIETPIDHPADYKPFHVLYEPTIRVNRGDQIIFSDPRTHKTQYRTVADVKSFKMLEGIETLRIHLLLSDASRLRQISVTNEQGRTIAIWVGDSGELKVGRSIRLHDDFDTWVIDGTFTTLAPHALPDDARVFHVLGID
jgi:hypothetical protein